MFIAIVVAAIALYRALIFIHEISHLKPEYLKGFKFVWNLLVGIPLLLPSFMYIGVHEEHHRLAIYGTKQDPEYLPFAGKKSTILVFIAHNLLIPAFLLLRFLILAPVAIVFPPFHRWLESHASSLSMNLHYCRQLKEQERSQIIATELAILSVWSIPMVLIWPGILSWQILAIWYVVMALITLVNSLRTLGAHHYRNSGDSMDRDSQLLDSINTPGTFWTTLWAPVGLRYHALHHYFPTMPYHNLAIAHQRLIQQLPDDSVYLKTSSSSLWHSLKTLWQDVKY
jgi:fatty acid desaturase